MVGLCLYSAVVTWYGGAMPPQCGGCAEAMPLQRGSFGGAIQCGSYDGSMPLQCGSFGGAMSTVRYAMGVGLGLTCF